jgi:EAL domain-containing protein (putative c-di-GMP-specific phosphodiesterase class I)/CheY-like chemotaxis protein
MANAATERGVRVLLVDDDEAILRDYGRLLRAQGFGVDAAASGALALERLADRDYDVIVSDVSMPEMTGLEFMRAVRARNLDIPIVLVTGMLDINSAVQAIEYGAFRYLLKPVETDILIQVLEKGANLHKLAALKREALFVSGSEGMELGDRAALEARFENALRTLWMAYQPIVRYPAQQVFGYEALVRCSEASIAHPGVLFDTADRLGKLHQLGRAIRDRVAHDLTDAPRDALLFVNVHAGELHDPELVSPRAKLSQVAARVVLEITERSALDRVPGAAARVADLRHLGFRIAVDDLGAGYAGLASFSQLDPEFVKLDMSLVRDVHVNLKKRSVVRALLGLCRDELGVDVICEGVELSEERDALSAAGAVLMQGYLFARPQRGFAPPNW